MHDTLIKDTQAFMAQLAVNNTRAWFLEHKAAYDATLRDPARAVLETMSGALAEMTGYPITPKLFRPHRDVRFSKDKTPYKTHLHMMWTVQTGTRQDPAIFFGIDAQGATVETGMMEFSKPVLMDWRKMVDLDGAYMAERIARVTVGPYALWAPALKRVPAPFDKTHPHGDLLRHKGLVVGGQPPLQGDLIEALCAQIAGIWPLSDMLIGVAETPTI